MEFKYIMIRYGEIGTKGKNKKNFINILFPPMGNNKRANGNAQQHENKRYKHPQSNRFHVNLQIKITNPAATRQKNKNSCQTDI